MQQRDFTKDDCNGWLVQVVIAKVLVHNINDEIMPRQFYGQRVAVSWVSFGITFVALAILTLLSQLQQGKSKWQMGCTMLFWALVQIPLLNVNNRLHTAVSPENEPIDREQYKRNLIAWWAIQQWVTMALILVIWTSVVYFKKIQVELVLDQERKSQLQQTISRENKVSSIFLILNVVYQVPLFIFVNVQVFADLTGNTNKEPFNQNDVNTAVFIGLMNCLFIMIFFVLMAGQIFSLLEIIKESVPYNCARKSLYLCIPILTVIFINDVFTMMLYYWGAPANTMTSKNDDHGCKSWIINQVTFEDGKIWELTSFGTFLRIILSVSEVTPLIWSLFFATTFFAMQYAYYAPIHHDTAAQHRQILVQKNQKNQKNINYTNNTDLSNSGQNTMDYSRNELK